MAAGPGILIIDISSTTRRNLITALQQSAPFSTYHSCSSGKEALSLARNNATDVILCGTTLSDMRGVKLLRQLQQDEDLRDIPVIILTGQCTTAQKLTLIEQGASDYLVMPFDSGELIARVKVQLKMKTLHDNLKRSNRLLLTLSSTDSLTRLYNRRMLMQTLSREVERHSRSDQVLSVLMLDIDHFKNINDTFGHLNGDKVLVAIAKVLKRYLRPYDIATRFGGEEFVLVLPNTTAKHAMDVAERLREAVEEITFDGELRELTVTTSIGIACYPRPGIDGVDDLLKAADEALYHAKNTGRNRVASCCDAEQATDHSADDTPSSAVPTL